MSLVHAIQHGFYHVLGFGARDEDGGGDDEVHTPEFLMAGNVLRGDTTGALVQSGLVAGGFVGREFALGMCVEIGTIAAEGKHEKQFGVHARGRDVVRGEAGDGGGESLL